MAGEAVKAGVVRCNWAPTLSELTDTRGGPDRTNLEMHLEAEIE